MWPSFERVQEFADGVRPHNRVAEWQRGVELVVVVSTDSTARQVSSRDQVRKDSVRRPLGDADRASDLPHAQLRLLRDDEQHLCMVRHECPRAELPRRVGDLSWPRANDIRRDRRLSLWQRTV
jgi:hypothetical protein